MWLAFYFYWRALAETSQSKKLICDAGGGIQERRRGLDQLCGLQGWAGLGQASRKGDRQGASARRQFYNSWKLIRMIVEKYDLRNRITRDQRQLKISQWLGLGSECWAWLEMLVFDKNKLNKPELRLSQRHRKSQGSKPMKTRTNNVYGLGAIKGCL